MRFQCVNCKQSIRVANDKAGTAVSCGECGCTVAVPPERYAPGVVIGDFRIINKIGEGAVGTVYYAHQISLDRPAALKILHSQFGNNPEYREQFLHEARTAAKLNHPGIVQAYAVGEEEGDYFFAMEYVEGSTLKKVLAHSGSVMVQRAVQIARQVTEALDFAWTNARLVHRDIKPDNIILTEDGEVKVADLGLAKVGGDFLGEDADNVFGTPQYIAPEQLMGEEVDCRSDIYSLGATFYQLVTGQYPYSGEEPGIICRKHLYEALTPPNKLVPEVPGEVSVLIQIMMSKRPANRYQTPRELLDDIANVEAGRPLKRQLPSDSQELFAEEQSPEAAASGGKAEVQEGGEQPSEGVEPAGSGGGSKRKIKLHRRSEGGEQAGGAVASGGHSKAKIHVGRGSKPKIHLGETQGGGAGEPAASTGEGKPFEEKERRGLSGGVRIALVAVAVAVIVVGAAAGVWYAVANGGESAGNGGGDAGGGAARGGDAVVNEVEGLIAEGQEQQALQLVQAYTQQANPDSMKVAQLRLAVEDALEKEIRQLRDTRIDEQRAEWEERSEDLIEQARREAERERKLQEKKERERQRRLEQERKERERQRYLAKLQAEQQTIRGNVAEHCRQREYSRALLAVAPLASVEEESFVKWAEQMETVVGMAKKCFEMVSDSEEKLRGFNPNPQHWPLYDHLVALQVNYISSNSVIVRYARKLYEKGVFTEMEKGMTNVRLDKVTPAAMGELFDEAWRRAGRDSLTQRDLLFAAYLVCEARALTMAQQRLEGSIGPAAEFMEAEITAMRKLFPDS